MKSRVSTQPPPRSVTLPWNPGGVGDWWGWSHGRVCGRGIFEEILLHSFSEEARRNTGMGFQRVFPKRLPRVSKSEMAAGWNSPIRQLGWKFFPVMGLIRPAATRVLPPCPGSAMRKGMSCFRNSSARQVPARP